MTGNAAEAVATAAVAASAALSLQRRGAGSVVSSCSCCGNEWVASQEGVGNEEGIATHCRLGQCPSRHGHDLSETLGDAGGGEEAEMLSVVNEMAAGALVQHRRVVLGEWRATGKSHKVSATLRYRLTSGREVLSACICVWGAHRHGAAAQQSRAWGFRLMRCSPLTGAPCRTFQSQGHPPHRGTPTHR